MAEEMNTEQLPDKEDKVVETAPKESSSKGEYAEAAMGYIKGLNPGLELGDDNYVSTMEKTVVETIMPRMAAYDDANKNLKAMIHGDPKLGKVLGDMAKGAKFEEALPRYYDVRSLELQPGDPDYSAWEAANKQRLSDYDADMDRQTQLENNRRKSEETIQSWFEEKQMNDEAKQEYGSFVGELLERAYAGEITPEFLNKMHAAMNYNKDVSAAAKAGEIKGKNEKIVEETMDEETKLQGDSLPVVDGGAAKEPEEKAPDNADPLVQSLRGRSKVKSVLPNNY